MPRKTPDLTAPLFDAEPPADAPLAARMRPRSLDEFVGQVALIGEDGALSRVVKPGYLPSMVLWGPPGSGKTTLARLLAERSEGTWRQLSAVTSGVADVRALVADAKALRQQGGRTVAFIDELHRFNKAQQDALLPHVEDGTITLIGATTENPYYELNSPLLSRLRVYRLEPLAEEELRVIVQRALTEERGLGGRMSLTDEALASLLDLSGGDARQALNILEAVASVAPDGVDIGPEAVAEAAQQRLLAYDRVGDQHYEAASAFIKSMRGNDPDAALYWCASMVAAGEDPTFIARRIVIAASEDVGNADPRALQVAVSAMQAVEMIGLPEAQYALAQAAAYVASAPKSNRAGAAYFSALADVEEKGRLPVPLHLRPSAHRRLAREHGYGKGYLYPHDYEDADVDQQYLPDALAGHVYYEPSDQGLEQQIGERLARLRRQRRDQGRADDARDRLPVGVVHRLAWPASFVTKARAASASRCLVCWQRERSSTRWSRAGIRSTRCTSRSSRWPRSGMATSPPTPRWARCSRSSSCWLGWACWSSSSPRWLARPSVAPRDGSRSARRSAAPGRQRTSEPTVEERDPGASG